MLVAEPTNTRAGAGDLGPLWSSGYLPGRARRRVASAAAGDPILLHQQPARRLARRPPQHARRPQRAQRDRHCQQLGDPETQTRIAAVRNGLPHAGQRAGTDRPRQRAGATLTSCTAKQPKKPGTLRQHACCWPGGWSSAACASCRSTTTTGTTTATSPAACPTSASDVDQPCYGADPGPEAARHARRHAGHLGRRVRPHDLLPGRPLAARTTAATTTRAASPCGWPAAASKGGTIYGETDDFSYNIVKDPVHIRDFHATVLHLLGFDHDRFTFKHQGLDQKLTGVIPRRW